MVENESVSCTAASSDSSRTIGTRSAAANDSASSVDDEKSEMIERARQLVEGGASLSEVTRQLSDQMNRSPETIRYTLKNFDADNQSLAIFPNHRGALTEDDKRSIFKLYTHGATVAQLCKRFKRTRTSIQRILLDMRLEQIMELPLDYIYNEDFEDASREAEYLGPVPNRPRHPEKCASPPGCPATWRHCTTFRC